MDDRFAQVGIRPVAVVQESKKKWYVGKPLVSVIVLAVIILGCLGCELFIPRDPAYMDLYSANIPPGREYWFGTDAMGRDLFSMIWYGGHHRDRGSRLAYKKMI